jgi:hypothetical protein
MKSWKKSALALATVGVLSAQAYASEVQVDQLPAVSFSQADVHAMFEPTDKTMEIIALSSDEMKETEGAWAPLVLWGLRFATSPTVHRQVLNTFNSSAFMPLAHGAHWVERQRIQHWPNSRWW